MTLNHPLLKPALQPSPPTRRESPFALKVRLQSLTKLATNLECLPEVRKKWRDDAADAGGGKGKEGDIKLSFLEIGSR